MDDEKAPNQHSPFKSRASENKEAFKQKRSRSEFIELHFEAVFLAKQELEN